MSKIRGNGFCQGYGLDNKGYGLDKRGYGAIPIYSSPPPRLGNGI